ncbi:phosphoribosylaminoimidazolesuccinocarboxamide synthase [Candidatus Woesearchaeota archaeon]|nr:MAG: phosphoribosylaminoimidazolesuccinocarboxamide synthase [Candidatus Woesearchaeota archaeon]
MMIKEQLDNTIKETNFESLGKLERGKVRDNYFDDGRIIMITTDRISAFDHVVGTVPFKGQVLTQIAAFWFNMTKDIVRNHLTDVPDPNVMVVRKCEPLPVEVVVRAYLTGSAWRDYKAGKDISGIKLPAGLKKDQKFDKPIITPSTKAERGEHDMPISREEIIERGLVDEETWNKIEEIALKLFARGTEHAAKQGLILVDTKYEFGLLDGEIVLMDEIHTPDSSRYWYSDTYQELFEKGEEQRSLDKEHVREWLRQHGFSGDGSPPPLDAGIRIEAARRYIKVYEQITGRKFEFLKVPILDRIRKHLKDAGYLKEEE